MKSIPSVNILMIHLGALGAVIRSTALLAAIHRKYPGCRLIWVTDAPAHNLLQNNPLIDHVYTTAQADILALQSWDFDVVFVVDKSLTATGIARQLQLDRNSQYFGFTSDARSGAILPATNSALELWELGLSNDKKFFSNKKSELELVHQALELGPYGRDPYFVPLTAAEFASANERRAQWQLAEGPVVGLNTGCSPIFPNKKWTIEYHRQLVQELLDQGFSNIVLLGGREDQLRNSEIARGLRVHQSATDQGVRDGLTSVEACDIVISGDSAGMHMAIARKKFVIAWFGPTCAQEIDLFDRGVKLQAKVGCAPCWKRACDHQQMCYDRVDLADVLAAVHKGSNWWQKQQNIQQEASKGRLQTPAQ